MENNFEIVLKELNIEYKISGNEAVAKCPVHDDRHPSWSLNLKTGVHHCFSCGFSGSLASLVMNVLNLSYPEAVLWCNSRVGWARAYQWREDKKETNFSPSYMKISEADMALFISPPDQQLKSKGLTRKAAQEYDVRWNSQEDEWIFPVRDPYTYELWGWQSKNRRDFRHYPRGLRKSQTLFGMGTFNNDCPIILVESPIDCAYIFSAGKRGGVSSYGVSVSDRQLSIIHRSTEHLILALDNDRRGLAETARLCKEFNQVGRISVFNYLNTDAKDPGECSYEEVIQGIEQAIPAIRWANVYRQTRCIPNPSEEEIRRPWKLINSLYNGTGQDSNSNRIGREINRNGQNKHSAYSMPGIVEVSVGRKDSRVYRLTQVRKKDRQSGYYSSRD